MNKDCFIVEDLLPLYAEDLLQPETASWLNQHLTTCPECAELVSLTEESFQHNIESSTDHTKMISKIKLKLSVYQIILVAISFFFALKTSLLQDSFGFILSYTLLGVLTYLFYRNGWVAALIAFLPIMLWSIAESILDFSTGELNISQFLISIPGAAILASFHLLFTLLGCIIAILILKLLERG